MWLQGLWLLKHAQACGCQHAWQYMLPLRQCKHSILQSLTVIFHVQQRSEKELRKVLTPDDAPIALRVVLHDAATYDVATGKGGLNGSIINRYMLTLGCDKHELCMNSQYTSCQFCYK